MKIFESIAHFSSNQQTVVTLGTFDGVHIGHKKIVDRLIQSADDENCESLILTFFPHPRMVLQEASDIKLLNTINERASLLSESGLDNLIIHPFDQAFSRLTAQEFVSSILIEKLKVKKIIIGHDHRFGRDRTANFEDLVAFGNRFGFEVEQISAREIDEVSVSSTKIRKALVLGDVALANTYLGYPYLLSGTVVKGRELGRTIGYPTANLEIAEPYKLIPKDGVYVVQSAINGQTVYGMMNIGNNPTIKGAQHSIETFYFDFAQDLYGQQISVSILHRLRDESKFESIALLQLQLQQDEADAKQYISSL